MVVAAVVGRLSDRGGIGGLAGLDSDSELESSLGGPGGLEAAEMNFLGTLEIPSSKNGSSCRLACSVSELFAPQRGKAPRFGGEDSDIPPISTVTGQGRLAALLEDDTIKIPPTNAETEQPNRQEDLFSDEGISKAPKKFISTVSKPPGPLSDNSSSESESEPIKPPIPL